MLESRVLQPAFLHRLEESMLAGPLLMAGELRGPAAPLDTTDPGFWDPAPLGPPGEQGSPPLLPPAEALEDWTLVDKQDVIDAIAAFLATYLATLPVRTYSCHRGHPAGTRPRCRARHVCAGVPRHETQRAAAAGGAGDRRDAEGQDQEALGLGPLPLQVWLLFGARMPGEGPSVTIEPGRRSGTLAYGAFAAFSNPWIVGATLRVLWTASKFLAWQRSS